MPEYHSYNEEMMNIVPYNPYYYYPSQPNFPSSLSPASVLEDSKSQAKMGSDLVSPSHFLPSPMTSLDFGRVDHRITNPPPYSQYAYSRPLMQGDHFRGYSSELNAPSSAELRGRAENWTYEETRTFVRLLMEHASEFQNIRRHPGLWNMLANRMVQHGFPRTVEKCKNRWKVLVAKYKRCHSEMQRQQSSKFSSTDKNTLILHDGSTPTAQASQSFEFFYQMETLLKPNYHIGADGVQRRFRSNPSEQPKRSTPLPFPSLPPPSKQAMLNPPPQSPPPPLSTTTPTTHCPNSPL
ncbi:Zinc finger and SCAN domain-containing protein 29 [Entomophthora muscae]|uniref:Zinc finger and SCAN domain-containing protein 29 n=1 Tax=Entomophthora muscae TaxID=34485 RepID=A0ACC2RH85_9FUNG|nr:Zinc finger and SCAN domain-containing protein 29 [Entomophthora muscae]